MDQLTLEQKVSLMSGSVVDLNKVSQEQIAEMMGSMLDVQVYVGFENSAVDRPVKQLRGFQRVSVKAGEEKAVVIKTPLEKLKWYDPVYREWKLEKMEYPIYVGSSAAEEDLVKTAITI